MQPVFLTGGSRRNAIPRQARAVVLAFAGEKEKLAELAAVAKKALLVELGSADPGLVIRVTPPSSEEGVDRVWTDSFARRTIDLLTALPHGVSAMSRDVEGVVETSTNLATATWEPNRLVVGLNSRSSTNSVLEETRNAILAIGRLAGGTTVAGHSYPGWRPDMESRLLAETRKVVHEVYGSPPTVTAIHAGLECGILSERLPDLQLISFGPNIKGAHTPNENVSVSSTRTFYDALLILLDRLSG